MSTAQTFADTFVAPGRALAAAADRRSFLPAIAAATVTSLLLAAVLAPRIDYERAFDEQLERSPQATQQMTPHEREVALSQARRLGGVLTYGAGFLWPAARAVAVAFGMLVAFRVAGAKLPFAGALAVSSWGLLPLAVKDLLSLPALLRMRGISAQDSERALPSSLAALLPPGAQGPLAGAAQALDLFSIWSLALVALGMAHVAGVSLRRSFAVVGVLWCSYVLIAHVAGPGLTNGVPVTLG